MNNQFATQFLLEDQDEINASIKDVISQEALLERDLFCEKHKILP